MENIKSSDAVGPPRERFTVEALAQVLTAELALTPDVPLCVAYSGGMDSHVLLYALAALRAHAPWRVTALHVDHALQAPSAQWQRHCAEVCAALDVPYRSERVSVDGIGDYGLEDAARRVRYLALARLLPPGAVLLTAHHQDDQAETLLLQLVRGAGVQGLAAMPAIAPFATGRLARPLLGFARAALAAYAGERQLRWIEDASNQEVRLGRNFLRHRVMSVLAQRWPHAPEAIARAARHQAQAARLLEEIAREDLAAALDEEGGLAISRVLLLSPERQANLVRHWVRANGVSAPSEPVLRQILARLRSDPQTRHATVAWANVEARRYRDRLTLRVAVPDVADDWEAAWEPGAALVIPGAPWQLRAQPAIGAGVSRACIAGKTLRVRLRRGGERCLLRGHHHKVKKLLQEAGVPPWERARLPLLYVDDDLAAIGDRWVCEPYGARADEPGLVLVLERLIG